MAKNYLIEDYIIPSLENGKFGPLLKWDNKKAGTFVLRLCNKSNRRWKEEDCAVFMEWDRINNRANITEKNYYTNARGRFLNALNRLRTKVEEIPSPNKKKYRIYQLKNYSSNLNEMKELSQLLIEHQYENKENTLLSDPVYSENEQIKKSFLALNDENIKPQSLNVIFDKLKSQNNRNEYNIAKDLESSPSTSGSDCLDCFEDQHSETLFNECNITDLESSPSTSGSDCLDCFEDKLSETLFNEEHGSSVTNFDNYDFDDFDDFDLMLPDDLFKQNDIEKNDFMATDEWIVTDPSVCWNAINDNSPSLYVDVINIDDKIKKMN